MSGNISYKLESKGTTIEKVYLEKKYVGDIKVNKANGWYFYKPKGGYKGQEMGTIAEVKASLEDE